MLPSLFFSLPQETTLNQTVPQIRQRHRLQVRSKSPQSSPYEERLGSTIAGSSAAPIGRDEFPWPGFPEFLSQGRQRGQVKAVNPLHSSFCPAGLCYIGKVLGKISQALFFLLGVLPSDTEFGFSRSSGNTISGDDSSSQWNFVTCFPFHFWGAETELLYFSALHIKSLPHLCECTYGVKW